jgi:hypothetical protein
MNTFRFLAASMVMVLALLAASPEAHGAVVAECVPPNVSSGRSAAGFNNGSFRPAQTFVPQMSGILETVELGLYSLEANDVVVEIRSTSEGVPTTTILDSAVIVGGPFSDDSLHTAHFGSTLALTAGVTYAIALRTVNPSPNVLVLASFPACTTNGTVLYYDSWDEGHTWSPWTDRSFVYRVSLNVPTPAVASTWGSVKACYR